MVWQTWVIILVNQLLCAHERLKAALGLLRVKKHIIDFLIWLINTAFITQSSHSPPLCIRHNLSHGINMLCNYSQNSLPQKPPFRERHFNLSTLPSVVTCSNTLSTTPFRTMPKNPDTPNNNALSDPTVRIMTGELQPKCNCVCVWLFCTNITSGALMGI